VSETEPTTEEEAEPDANFGDEGAGPEPEPDDANGAV
jgi:hypothetical protein